MKKLLAVSIMTAAALTVVTPVFADGYADITLGEDYTDLETTITVFNHRRLRWRYMEGVLGCVS